MEHNHKHGSRLLAILLFIVTLPFVLVGLVLFGLFYLITTVIPSPIERLVFKRSDYYKNVSKKYYMGVTSSFSYKSYKHVAQHPELKLVSQEDGYYYYKTKDSILIVPYYADFVYKDDKWMMTMNEGGDFTALEDARDSFLCMVKENANGYKVKLLVKEDKFKKDQLLLAKSDPVFVFYETYKDFSSLKI